MVSEVTASRDIITTSQSSASYSEQIDAVPACSGGSVRTPSTPCWQLTTTRLL